MATSQIIARWEAPADSQKSSYSGVSIITDDTDESHKLQRANGVIQKQPKIEKKPEGPEKEDTDAEETPETAQKANVSQRKRQQYAVFDSWKNSRAKNGSEDKKTKAKNEVDELLTIRGLMNRIETDKIIDSPRDYQLELFERAKKENTIAVLDTGTGKTLIAVLLLKHILEQELASRALGNSQRLAFFVVDVSTLVYQQFAVLEHNLDQPIDRFCGEMNIDSWDKGAWAVHFEKNMAIVCTADVLYNCLSRGFITIERINLLIFDEAHHTKKNHAYARIIREFYQDAPKDGRPKIFGMTASPVDAKVDVEQAARDLENLLDSKIATTSDPAFMQGSGIRPTESVLHYAQLPRPYGTPLCVELQNKCGPSLALKYYFNQAKLIASELGDYCADRLWQMVLDQEDEFQRLWRKTEQEFPSDAISQDALEFELQMLKEAKHIVVNSFDLIAQCSPGMRSPQLSSKVMELRDFLNLEFEAPTESRCIVFVKRRWTARLLTDLFRKIGSPHIRAGTLMGTRQAESGDMKVSIRQQMMTLLKIRCGDINVLFATSIAEEGLDIPLCNVIIRFDLYTTMIQYIQSRGRARHQNSKFIHMLEGGNLKEQCTLEEVKFGEATLRAFCQRLPEDRLLKGIEADFDDSLLKGKSYPVYKEPTTGAKLTFGTVLLQLDYFVACLPQHEENLVRALFIPIFQSKRYVYEVLLPASSPIRSIIGKAYSRKSIAKRSAAFEACLQLRANGYLDENLLPIYHKQLPAMRNAHLALNVKKSNAYDLQIKPTFWEESWGSIPTKLSVTLIRIAEPALVLGDRTPAPLLLLTRESLPEMPSFPVYLKPGVTSDVYFTRFSNSLEVGDLDVHRLTDYTLQAFLDPFHKAFTLNIDRMSYWLAPVRQGSENFGDPQDYIDWESIVAAAADGQTAPSRKIPDTDLQNRFYVDPHGGTLRYITKNVRPDLCALDPAPEGVTKTNHRFFKSILGYTSALWRTTEEYLAKYDLNQPVFEAFQIPYRRNWLDDFEEGDLMANTRAVICADPLNISALSVPIVTMLYVFPSLIWRIDSYLIAKEVCEMLGLDVKIGLALEAITKDSDNTDEHRAEQIQFQRGMGKNYERLEFIGDSFLKMATSISLYAQNAGDDEFESHVKRMLMICNKNLFKNAVEMGLYKYIRSQSFSRRMWYPEGLKLTKGKQTGMSKTFEGRYAPQKHALNDKTIADVCEALIGAALISHTESGNMDPAVKAVTALVKNPDHDVQTWADYYKLYSIPKYQSDASTAAHIDLANQIEQRMGYKFKWPRVLRAAFTHPSWPYAWGNIPSYQRLEFLGDSLLDMVCINFLFYRYPDKDPQWLTEHKMAMVSNKFLGALCVRLKFHKHLKTNHNTLMFQIHEFVDEIETAERESNGARDYWTNPKNPPKCLPDIVESYIGAIFVDSCFSFQVVEQFFEDHVRWYFEDMSIYDSFANNQPTTFLSNLLTNTFNCTHYRVLADEIPNVDGTNNRVMAVVMVHFQIIADAESSSSKYAKIKASHKAREMLEGLAPWEFRKKYSCDCKEDEHGNSVVSTEPSIKSVEQVIGNAI